MLTSKVPETIIWGVNDMLVASDPTEGGVGWVTDVTSPRGAMCGKRISYKRKGTGYRTLDGPVKFQPGKLVRMIMDTRALAHAEP